MLVHLSRVLHLPPPVAYIIVLAVLLLGAVILGVILHRIFHRVGGHVKGTWGDLTIEVLEFLILPFVVAGALDIAIEVVELPSRFEHGAAKLMSTVILVVFFNFLARAVAVFLRNLAKRDPSFLRLTQPAIMAERIIFGFLALSIFLENLNVSLTAVWTTLGVGSVAIGLALQATLSNLFAGITILADRPVSPGDHIILPGTANNVEGEVMRIGWRATQLRTSADEIIFVPNSIMASSVLMNYSLSGSGAVVSMAVKVNSGSDPDQVERTLLEAAKTSVVQFHPPTGQDPQVILSSNFTDPFLEFSVKVPVRGFADRDRVSAALRKEIANRYRRGELKNP
jgi:small-conductance mechanosensitive channel